MAIKPFRKINTSDADLMRVQDSVRDTFASIAQCVLLSGNIVQTNLATGLNDVAHGLNRNINGWFIVRQDAQAAIWEPAESNTPSKTVTLESTAAVRVTIYFF